MLKIDREGARLERPDDCPRGIYALALKCWAHSPDERPHFREIVSLLQEVRAETEKASGRGDGGGPVFLHPKEEVVICQDLRSGAKVALPPSKSTEAYFGGCALG